MPVPSSIDELDVIAANNFPKGTENVFPNLDNYMRAMAGFVAQLRDRVEAAGLELGDVLWKGGNRPSALPETRAFLDGEIANRADHPEIWAWVTGGGYAVVSDADWLSTRTKRGSFSTGDGTTTFRFPDLNGKQDGSIGAVTIRGDGAFSAGASGLIQDSQNLEHTHVATTNQTGSHSHQVTGVAATAGAHAHGVGSSFWHTQRDSNTNYERAAGGSDAVISSTAGNHSHEVSGTAASAGSHSHTVTVNAAGGTEARGKVVTGFYVMRVK